MPDKDAPDEGKYREPIETGPVHNMAAGDPGPIEVDVVMKGIGQAGDPMGNVDLHLDDVGDDG